MHFIIFEFFFNCKKKKCSKNHLIFLIGILIKYHSQQTKKDISYMKKIKNCIDIDQQRNSIWKGIISSCC